MRPLGIRVALEHVLGGRSSDRIDAEPPALGQRRRAPSAGAGDREPAAIDLDHTAPGQEVEAPPRRQIADLDPPN